jgi:amino acid transporter
MLFTKAQKKQFGRIAVFLSFYFVAFFWAFRYVRHHHPYGIVLYLCTAVPWTMMCGFIASTGMYLYEERDGYGREIAMRCLLWGAAGAMATNFFVMFLHIFGWRGQAPVYLEICVFAAASAVARVSYEIANCPKGEAKENEQ